MSLYPTFENLRVDDVLHSRDAAQANAVTHSALAEYMGINMADYYYNDRGELVAGSAPKPSDPTPVPASPQHPPAKPQSSRALVEPSICPGEIKHGVRRVVLCKDANGKVGVQLVAVDNGIFVSLVQKNSPAALGGLRFGDQILSVSGNFLAGHSSRKAMDYFRKGPVNGIELVVRDRPFERTVVVNKDYRGEIGIRLSDGMISAIVKGSSAARNGVLTHHQIVEVNGQNVMGMKDKHLMALLEQTPNPIRLTLLPRHLYRHMLMKLWNTDIYKEMDHSMPEA